MVYGFPWWAARCLSVAAALLAPTAFFGQWSSTLRRLKDSSLVAAADDAIIYGVGKDNNVYQQRLDEMTVYSSWTLAGRGIVTFISIRGDTVYGVGGDMRVHTQKLHEMDITTRQWEPASKPSVVSFAFQGDTIYAVAEDLSLCKQKLNTMTVSSDWEDLRVTGVMSIAIHGDTFYAVFENDHRVYSHDMRKDMGGTNSWFWQSAGAAYVDAIAIQVGTIFGIGGNKVLYRQRLAEMTPTSSWEIASNGPVESVAVWVPPSYEEAPDIAKDRVSGNGAALDQNMLAKQVNNMHYLTLGYNIFSGNPDSAAGSDDGFMEPIFKMSYEGGGVSVDGLLKVPDGFRLQRHIVCNGTFQSDYFHSMSMYLHKLIHRTGLEMLSGLRFLSGAFRLNPDFYVTERIFGHGATVVTSVARCTTYQAAREDSHKPVFTEEFRKAVETLPKAYGDGREYMKFLQRFGTHYPTSMEFGSIFGDVQVISKANQRFFENHKELDITAVGARVAASHLQMAPDSGDSKLESEKNAFSSHARPGHLILEGKAPPIREGRRHLKDWIQASLDDPIPISYSLSLITKLLPASAQVNMHRAFTEFCKKYALPDMPEECQSTSECESLADCPEGLYCSLGQCMAICRHKEDCDFPALCIAGRCTEMCSNIWLNREEVGNTDSELSYLLPYRMDSSKKKGGAPTWWDPSSTHTIFYDESAGDWVLAAVRNSSSAHKRRDLVRARFLNMPDQHNRRLWATWQVDISNAEEPDFRRMQIEVSCEKTATSLG